MDRIEPMLAQSIDPKRADKYINDDGWYAEQKLDGVRLTVHLSGGQVIPFKRSGNIDHCLPVPAVTWFQQFTGDWVFDGEFINGTFWIFDLPHALDGRVHINFAYQIRRDTLDKFYEQLDPPASIRLLPCARTTQEKRTLHDRCLWAGYEGVMFKSSGGVYRPAVRSNDVLKCKFVKTCEVIVMEVGRDGKENAVLGMAVLDDPANPKIVEVGKCSLIGKAKVERGDVIEVKYLYATDDHRLYQPRMMRVRDDKALRECTFDQLQYTRKEVLDGLDP